MAEKTETDGQTGLGRWNDPGTLAGAAALERLNDARIGSDRGSDRYAVYFYDQAGEEIRSVGGFDTVGDAAEAVPLIRAEQVIRQALAANWAVGRTK